MAPRTPRPPSRALDSASRSPRVSSRVGDVDPFGEPEDDPDPIDLPLTERKLVPLVNPPALTREEARDARPPPPGYRYTLDGRLVPLVESTLSIDSADAQAIFCQVLEATGSLQTAMDSLGIRSKATIERALNKYPSFAEACEFSAERHRQTIYQAAHARAVHGHLVPIVGGKDKDRIVAWERKYSDTLMLSFLKRHFPEFRETKPTAPTPPPTGIALPDARAMSPAKRAALRILLSPDPNPQSSDPLPAVIDVTPAPSDPSTDN